MVRLLNQADWGEDRGRIQRLKGWVYYPPPAGGLRHLAGRRRCSSAIHGPAHIHRVLLLSALVCQGEGWGRGWSARCSGRPATTTWAAPLTGTTWTTAPGRPCAWPKLTGQTRGGPAELQAAVTAHARPDPGDGGGGGLLSPPRTSPGPGTHPPAEGRGQPGPGAFGRSGPPGSSGTAVPKPLRALPNAPLPALSRGGERRGGPGGPRDKNLGK